MAQIGLAEDQFFYSTGDATAINNEDTSHLFTITEIIIEGNRQTKPYMINRELAFQKGEEYTLPNLVYRFSETKRQLMNTGMFADVVVSLKSMQGYEASVKIDVKERWYIYPIPFIRAVDRNINEWIKEQDMDLTRVNYGIKITHKNTTGRNDKLDVYLMNGYTKQVSLAYYGLRLDKKLHWTSSLGFALGKNKELRYITTGDKQLIYKSQDHFVHSYFRSFLEFSYRPAIKTKHTFGIAYNREIYPDTIFSINPFFTTSQQKKVNYPELYYIMQYFDVDFIPYPTKGYAAELIFRRKGINNRVNLWQLTAKGSGTWPVSDKNFFNLRTVGIVKLPFRQPYITRQFLGANDMFLQGYETYTIDGVAGGYAKATLSRQFLNTIIHIPSQKIKRINTIPLKIYGKIYGNTGYVYNIQSGPNNLDNKLLYSGGLGVDIVAFYDFIIRLEWSFNQLGQNGLYLHRKNYF